MNARALLLPLFALALVPLGARGGAVADEADALHGIPLEQPSQGGSADFEAALREWEAEMAHPVEWQPLTAHDVQVEGGPKLVIARDGSVTAKGRAAYPDVFSITARTALRGITAFRIEFVADANAPTNALIGELRISAAPEPTAPRRGRHGRKQIALRNASTDVDESGNKVARIIDEDEESQWRFVIPQEEARSVVVETVKPIGDGNRTELVFRIARNEGERRTLGRVRLFATTKPYPVRVLPTALRKILAIEPSERSEAQRKQIDAYFRRHSEPYR